MKFTLWKIRYPFRATPNSIEVTLALDMPTGDPADSAEVTIILTANDVRALTLGEIESRAIARATAGLVQQPAVP